MADANFNNLPPEAKAAVANLANKIADLTGTDTAGGVTLEVDGAKLVVPESAL